MLHLDHAKMVTLLLLVLFVSSTLIAFVRATDVFFREDWNTLDSGIWLVQPNTVCAISPAGQLHFEGTNIWGHMSPPLSCSVSFRLKVDQLSPLPGWPYTAYFRFDLVTHDDRFFSFYILSTSYQIGSKPVILSDISMGQWITYTLVIDDAAGTIIAFKDGNLIGTGDVVDYSSSGPYSNGLIIEATEIRGNAEGHMDYIVIDRDTSIPEYTSLLPIFGFVVISFITLIIIRTKKNNNHHA